MDIKKIKLEAKELAFKNKSKIFFPILIYIILCAISSIVSTISLGFIAAIISLILLAILSIILVGILSYVMQITLDKDANLINCIISKVNLAPTIIMTFVITYIATILWTVMLIIPGILYLISVSMIIYILADPIDTPNNWSKVITTSRKMIYKHELEFIKLNLSLIGWVLLSIVTLGIGSFWAVPYIIVTNIEYYKELKASLKNKEIQMPKLANKKTEGE